MLTDTQCKGFKPQGKLYKKSDAGGLYLAVLPSGEKSWRQKYHYAGKERLLVHGSYPKLGLREARALRDKAKDLLKEGKDPNVEAKREKIASSLAATDTFELLAREWFDKQKGRWGAVHARDVIESLERDVFPSLGTLPVGQIDSDLVLATLRAVEKRSAIETAHRLRQRISAIFEYGTHAKRVSGDPAAVLGKVLTPKPRSRLRPAVVTLDEAREVLHRTDTAEATPIVKLASRFLALTAQRPGLVQRVEWRELVGFDPADQTANNEVRWIVPASKLKQEITLRQDAAFAHPVPLTPAAVEVLREAWRFSGGSRHVFAGHHSADKPMSENALNYLFAREGLKGRHVPHGWRSTFLSLMNEWVTSKIS